MHHWHNLEPEHKLKPGGRNRNKKHAWWLFSGLLFTYIPLSLLIYIVLVNLFRGSLVLKAPCKIALTLKIKNKLRKYPTDVSTSQFDGSHYLIEVSPFLVTLTSYTFTKTNHYTIFQENESMLNFFCIQTITIINS